MGVKEAPPPACSNNTIGTGNLARSGAGILQDSPALRLAGSRFGWLAGLGGRQPTGFGGQSRVRLAAA